MEAQQQEANCPPGHRLIAPVRWLLVLNILVVLLLSILVFRGSPHTTAARWEYMTEQISDSGFTDRMNVLGKKGWEMITASPATDGQGPVSGYEVVFKRPVSVE